MRDLVLIMLVTMTTMGIVVSMILNRILSHPSLLVFAR
jgi:hypothetical protein